jgi:predicted RNase H-like nuclease
MGTGQLTRADSEPDRSCHFVGIDLAWSERNPSGIAVLRLSGDVATLVTLLPINPLHRDDEITDYVQRIVGSDDVIVAIDAPLVVPNSTGRRPAEAKLQTVFGRFHAGAHPANRQRLAGYNNGAIRGEVLVDRLAVLGIGHSPVIMRRTSARQVFEVYPHPAIVVLFGLDSVLKYKAKRNRSPQQRREAFRAYQRHLGNLKHADPPAIIPEALLSEDHLTKRGRALKDYEDQLDAIMCAYIALYYWWWGLERCHVFGDLENGYIVSPVDTRMSPL